MIKEIRAFQEGSLSRGVSICPEVAAFYQALPPRQKPSSVNKYCRSKTLPDPKIMWSLVFGGGMTHIFLSLLNVEKPQASFFCDQLRGGKKNANETQEANFSGVETTDGSEATLLRYEAGIKNIREADQKKSIALVTAEVTEKARTS